MQTVSISFFRFDSTISRLWALTMMGAARLSLARMPDLDFWKLCGSGTGEGFTPVPNTAVYAILASWPSEAVARHRLQQEKLFRRYRNRAAENWTILLAPTSVRGAWSGRKPFEAMARQGNGPIAALTRATIKPRVALKFWGHVPNISEVIGADPNVVFKIGIGELPLLHQVTFSIWPDAASMSAFARDAAGPHAQAIAAVRDGKWFREELYARFHVLGDFGSWEGKSPLERLEDAR
jgi:spheroidene monooxygenase